MLTRKLTLSLLFLFSSLFCFAQSDQKGTDADKKSIDSLVNRIVSDWNTHEFKNMNSYATEDVDWAVFHYENMYRSSLHHRMGDWFFKQFTEAVEILVDALMS